MADNPWNENPESPDAPAKRDGNNGKEWKLIEKLVLSLGIEQRRARRWGIFFKLLTFFYLFLLLGLMVPNDWDKSTRKPGEKHTALVDVRGVIADGEKAGADVIVTGLRKAFEDEDTSAVMLRINSPGGSPVQAGYVYDEVKRLRAKYPETRLYAVISDIGASGAYYIAAAADEIYADKASLVGSIGVVTSSFGFVGTMEKLGVERRLLTAGEHKGMLDPFSPLDPKELQLWREVLETTHRQFITQVRNGRGDRLKDDPILFTGTLWSGEQAVELGLVDGLGSAGYVAREIVGAEEIVDFTPEPSPFKRFVDELGVSIGRTLASYMGLAGAGLR